MDYKYMEKQVEGAKALAEKYPHIQTHQDIYREHVEVLEKAKALDILLQLYKEALEELTPSEDLCDDMCHVLDKYIWNTEDKNNE
ncbi:hypothetical protein [Staphylococcus simulans]|uniref:hypothetical protein n=1 Tax=Staphylococcus simulans TaxID=1286 RepID=UPI0021D17D91|nr:hypothetical protein [Staphylococcus simulans]UXR49096.1 hypothetical protein MUA28_08030 [Staphylococcus simulans]